MEFLKFLEHRADETDELGVVANDLLEEELIPFGSSDEIVLNVIDNSFKDTPVKEAWSKLKSEYLSQKSN